MIQMRGLYKGVVPPILAQGAINAIVFGTEGFTKRFVDSKLKDNGLKKEMTKGMLGGAAGGLLQTFVCAPMELVKLRTQHQEVGKATVYQGNWTTLKGIYKMRGITGCYQGFGVTAFRDTPAFAIYFATYTLLMEYSASRKGIKQDELSWVYNFFGGGIAGMTSWIFNYPVDLVKTRIQMDGVDGAERQYRSSWDCFTKAWRDGGVKLLYRGLAPSLVRAFANSACIFVAYEYSKKALHGFLIE